MVKIIYERPTQHSCKDELNLTTDRKIGMVVKCSCGKRYMWLRDSYHASSVYPEWERLNILQFIIYRRTSEKNKK